MAVDTGAVAVKEKANDATVTLQGDAQIVWTQGEWLSTEKAWGIIPRSTILHR